MSFRNRVKALQHVRAGDLIPNPLNWRRHPEHQRELLRTSLEEVGYADAVIARQTDDGLVLIDGHLRAGIDDDQVVPVLVTDLTEDEAGAMLASLDPLAGMAIPDVPALDRLLSSLKAKEGNPINRLLDGLPKVGAPQSTLANQSVQQPGASSAGSVAERYIEAPLSLLEARSTRWQERKKLWRGLIGNSLGRADELVGKAEQYLDRSFYTNKRRTERELGVELSTAEYTKYYWPGPANSATSQFDPVLAEIIVSWYSRPGWTVLDPFAGGQERGYVAAATGREYVGIDLSGDQIAHNERIIREAGLDGVTYVQGDSQNAETLVPTLKADLLMACPPYWNLEQYSDAPADLSNMQLDGFRAAHRKIVRAALGRLKQDRFAVWTVGDVRGKDGRYIRLPGQVFDDFMEAGAEFVAEMILARMIGSAAYMGARPFAKTRKIPLVHEHVLVFCKGDPARATEAVGPVEVAELSQGEGEDMDDD